MLVVTSPLQPYQHLTNYNCFIHTIDILLLYCYYMQEFFGLFFMNFGLNLPVATNPPCNKTDPIFELYAFFQSFYISYCPSLCYHVTIRLMSGSSDSHHAPLHMTKSSCM